MFQFNVNHLANLTIVFNSFFFLFRAHLKIQLFIWF